MQQLRCSGKTESWLFWGTIEFYVLDLSKVWISGLRSDERTLHDNRLLCFGVQLIEILIEICNFLLHHHLQEPDCSVCSFWGGFVPLLGGSLHHGADPAQFAPQPYVKCDTTLGSSKRHACSVCVNYIRNMCTLDSACVGVEKQGVRPPFLLGCAQQLSSGMPEGGSHW